MKKYIVLLFPIVFLFAGCDGSKQAKNDVKPNISTEQTNQKKPMGDSTTQSNKEDLRKLLEAASEKALEPISKSVSLADFPLNFVGVFQVGNHAAYIKSQQLEKASINFVLLHYTLEDGKWEYKGQSSDNYSYENLKNESPKDTEAINSLIVNMQDKYFAEMAVIDLHDDLQAGDSVSAKNLLSKDSQIDLTSLVAKNQIFKDNQGYSVSNSEINSPKAVIKLQIISSAGSRHAVFELIKEDVWKIRKIDFID